MNDADGMRATIEQANSKKQIEEGLLVAPRFDAFGLITAVVTDHVSGELLMVAYMDAEAFALTLQTQIAHYHSRSRGKLWKKGEISGALQTVHEIRVDCDQDAVWLKVEVAKPEETCHTRRATCFYRRVDLENGGRILLKD